MSLGIYDRLWDLLADACTQLDLQLAHHTDAADQGNSFSEYVGLLKKKQKLDAPSKLRNKGLPH